MKISVVCLGIAIAARFAFEVLSPRVMALIGWILFAYGVSALLLGIFYFVFTLQDRLEAWRARRRERRLKNTARSAVATTSQMRAEPRKQGAITPPGRGLYAAVLADREAASVPDNAHSAAAYQPRASLTGRIR
jgi:hypothetical protein